MRLLLIPGEALGAPACAEINRILGAEEELRTSHAILLAALEAVVGCGAYTDAHATIISQARAAIARAKGETG